MPYYFLCDCQTNTKNIFAKLHETYQTFLKKETNTENMPSSPSKRTKLKIPLGKGQICSINARLTVCHGRFGCNKSSWLLLQENCSVWPKFISVSHKIITKPYSIEGNKTNKDNFLQHCQTIIIILLISTFTLLHGLDGFYI